MLQPKLIIWVVVLAAGVCAFAIENDEQAAFTTPLQDMRNNVTDQEYNAIIQSIKEAETTFQPTDFQNIARYISLNSRLPNVGYIWSVYVFQGRIRQIGLSIANTHLHKQLILLNYGNFKLSYTLVSASNFYCLPINQINGGSSTDQFRGLNDTQKTAVFHAVDTAMTQKGSNIMQNALLIQQTVAKAVNVGIWTVVISDPGAGFGYHVCMKYLQTWFSLRAYGNLKWNYFGSALNSLNLGESGP